MAFQSELPYTATKAQFGQSCGYRVAPTVRAHSGWGVGVYAFFKEHNVTVASGIVCPRALEAERRVFFPARRSTPTANAEDPRRSEGT